MPKQIPREFIELADSSAGNADNVSPRETMREAEEKNPAAVTLGRLGGLKGGKARAAKLSPRRRKEIARKAAQARWKNK
jgi:hypothetical protein